MLGLRALNFALKDCIFLECAESQGRQLGQARPSSSSSMANSAISTILDDHIFDWRVEMQSAFDRRLAFQEDCRVAFEWALFPRLSAVWISMLELRALKDCIFLEGAESQGRQLAQSRPSSSSSMANSAISSILDDHIFDWRVERRSAWARRVGFDYNH